MISPDDSASGMNTAGGTASRRLLRQRISTSAPTIVAAAQIDDRLVVRDELVRIERAFHFDDRIGAAAPRDQDRQRECQQRQHCAADVSNGAQIGMFGEHRGARDDAVATSG